MRKGNKPNWFRYTSLRFRSMAISCSRTSGYPQKTSESMGRLCGRCRGRDVSLTSQDGCYFAAR